MDPCARPPVLTVHAAAVQVNGAALLFLGPSGTGKTTLCGLLEEHTAPLANDVVHLIRREEGGWSVADGVPQAYEGPLSEEEAAALPTVPLRAVFRLFQAAEPSLIPVDALDICRYLTDALFEIAWQRDYDVESKRMVFAALADVCRAVPGFEFRIARSPRTAEVLTESSLPISLFGG